MTEPKGGPNVLRIACHAQLSQCLVGHLVGGEVAFDAQLVQGNVVGRAEGRQRGEEPQVSLTLLHVDHQE